jgi:hypothetical protein
MMPGMHLARFMASRDLNDAGLVALLAARGVTVHPSVVSRWRRGLVRPSWPVLKALRDATAGRVSPDDFLEPTEA